MGISDWSSDVCSSDLIRDYWLEHADAEKLFPVLQQLGGEGGATAAASAATATVSAAGAAVPAGAPVSTPVASGGSGNGIASRGPAIVTRYEGANAIIVAANSDVQRMLGETIRQIDTRREQVLVEAIIVEISDAAARKLGVQRSDEHTSELQSIM